MAIVVAGYSGCAITVRPVRADDPLDGADVGAVHHVLEKLSSSVSYNPRLHRQIDKQEAYRARLAAAEAALGAVADVSAFMSDSSSQSIVPPGASPLYPFNHRVETSTAVAGPLLSVPRVLYRRTEPAAGGREGGGCEGILRIGMIFEHHTDCLSFLSKSPVKDIRAFADVLVRLLKAHVHESPLTPVPSHIIGDKLRDIQRVVQGNLHLVAHAAEILSIVDDLCQWIAAAADHLMPVGLCHGDLTLSNILVQRRPSSARPLRVVLIDFLDSFVETPLADLAKLSQDLVYGWTTRMAPNAASLDATRLFLAFSFIRAQLAEAFGNEVWYRHYYTFFFVVNQLRVLQYSASQDDVHHLLHSVRREFCNWREQLQVQASHGQP
jgi:hypothetical protein